MYKLSLKQYERSIFGTVPIDQFLRIIFSVDFWREAAAEDPERCESDSDRYQYRAEQLHLHSPVTYTSLQQCWASRLIYKKAETFTPHLLVSLLSLCSFIPDADHDDDEAGGDEAEPHV